MTTLTSVKPILHCNAKPLTFGPCVGGLENFLCWDTNMLVSKNPCGRNAMPDRPKAKPGMPNVSPKASRWNVGCVGSPRIGARVGHVHFMLFVSILFELGTQREPGF